MKYLFVMPSCTKIKTQSYVFPIGIAYVSASLRASGRNVYCLNMNYKDGTAEEIVGKYVLEHDIDVVAVGGLTAQYWAMKEIIDAAKQAKENVIIWVGGGIVTSDPVACMEAFANADVGMVGEGEITVCELAEATEAGGDLAGVNGLVYRKDGAWVQTAPRAEIDNLDEIPYPDYEAFEFGETIDKEPTDMFEIAGGHFACVSFGRSCPFQCTFCFHPSGSRYRKRSLDSVFDEIDWLLARYDIRNIYVTDELFSANMDYVREFCRRIKERKLGFMVQLRVDFVTEELVTLLKESGCITALLGLESADNRILKSMQKHITIEKIENALEILYKAGLNEQGTFIFGDLEETMETAMNTINWWKAHPQYLIKLAFIIVFPGTHLYHVACERGIITDKAKFIKDGCPYVNVSKLTDQEYSELSEMVDSLYAPTSVSLDYAEAEYTGNGKVTLHADCPDCGTRNHWRNRDPFRPEEYVYCSHCNKVMNILPADFAGKTADENLKRLLQRHKVAVWPVKNSVQVMADTMPSLLSEKVYMIDSSRFKQGTKLSGKTVCAPAVLEEEEIDTVILSITTPTAAEIIADIKKSHQGVKHILYAGDLLDEKNVSF